MADRSQKPNRQAGKGRPRRKGGAAATKQPAPEGRAGGGAVRPGRWEERIAREAALAVRGRLALGFERYGRLDPSSKTAEEWLEEAAEEFLDAYVYLRCALERMGG